MRNRLGNEGQLNERTVCLLENRKLVAGNMMRAAK